MEMPKPSEADRARFLDLVPEAPGVEAKPMFGNLGAFVNGNMFMGLFGADIGVKLSDADRERLLAVPGAGPFGPPERPMGGYVTMPAAWSATEAEEWVAAALATAAALPPKLPKPRAAKKAAGNSRPAGG
jgi:TfoX/Sxy family transcriptional regulator of competence genes